MILNSKIEWFADLKDWSLLLFWNSMMAESAYMPPGNLGRVPGDQAPVAYKPYLIRDMLQIVAYTMGQ